MALSTTEWLFQEKDTDRKKTNPNYLVVITCNDQGISLVANLPQSYGTNVRASYDSPFSQMVSNSVSSTVNNLARASGMQLTTKALSAQVWQGASDFTFDLPLVFQAIDDEYNDVTAKLLELHRLTLPGEGPLGILTAPGPYLDPKLVVQNLADSGLKVLKDAGSALSDGISALAGQMSGSSSGTASNAPNQSGPKENYHKRPLVSCVKNNISVKIGNYQFFESVVIEGINAEHKVQPMASGTMSAVEVTVSFKTFYTPTKEDLSTIFVNSRPSGVNAQSRR